MSDSVAVSAVQSRAVDTYIVWKSQVGSIWHELKHIDFDIWYIDSEVPAPVREALCKSQTGNGQEWQNELHVEFLTCVQSKLLRMK